MKMANQLVIYSLTTLKNNRLVIFPLIHSAIPQSDRNCIDLKITFIYLTSFCF